MKTNRSFHLNSFTTLGAVATLVAFGGISAPAAVVQLTGGDSSGGLTLTPGDVVYAVYTPSDSSTDASTATFQGVTFTAAAATAGVSGVPSGYLAVDGGGTNDDTATNAGFTNTSSPSANDTELLALENAGLQYNGGSTITLTFSGLADSTEYQVDSINSLVGYSGRTNTISYNGGAVSDTPDYVNDAGGSGSHEILAIEDTVQSTAGTGAANTGTISLTYSIGSDGPFYNAVVISTTPEPATYVLLGLGLVSLMIIARQKAPMLP
jgi:hypothetical protein